MSVDSKVFIGLTLEFASNFPSAEFRKCEAFLEKYPELDEYNIPYNRETYKRELEGKLVLIVDGMSSRYIRLIQVDKCTPGNLGHGSEIHELITPKNLDPELISKMTTLYEEYTGQTLDPEQLKYAMWTQWS